jgi:hypothetical protein
MVPRFVVGLRQPQTFVEERRTSEISLFLPFDWAKAVVRVSQGANVRFRMHTRLDLLKREFCLWPSSSRSAPSLYNRSSQQAAAEPLIRSMSLVRRLPTANRENSVAACDPGATYSMGNRRGRASPAGSDWKQSFTFFRPPAATDPKQPFEQPSVGGLLTKYSGRSRRPLAGKSPAKAACSASMHLLFPIQRPETTTGKRLVKDVEHFTTRQ